ncbi:MAG: hypothetical protein RLZZ500_2210 [Bacteroidota bacterium]|jgi:hypothetical protein
MLFKMKKIIFLWTTTLVSFGTQAQSKKGFWDTMRTTSETMELRAGEKKILKTNTLPEGTTELVYRITLLDENQKMSNSLVSVLKAIPDPTGISQGAAGAVFLASTISGDDKATFAIFTNEADANAYLTSGKTDKACYAQNTPTNKEARLIANGQLCMKESHTNLWFGFQSDNWLMKQKVVIEVVPWVDYQASTGWNEITKKEITALIKKRDVYPVLVQKEAFEAAFMKQISAKSTFFNFKKMEVAERNQFLSDCEKEALQQIGEADKRSEQLASAAYKLFSKGKTEEGIGRLQAEINTGNTDIVLYTTLIQCYLQTRQFAKAETCLAAAKKTNSTDLRLFLAEAHVDLFTDKVSEAKALYSKYVMQNLPNGKPWKTQVLNDILLFERAGLPTEHFKKIKRIVE